MDFLSFMFKCIIFVKGWGIERRDGGYFPPDLLLSVFNCKGMKTHECSDPMRSYLCLDFTLSLSMRVKENKSYFSIQNYVKAKKIKNKIKSCSTNIFLQ